MASGYYNWSVQPWSNKWPLGGLSRIVSMAFKKPMVNFGLISKVGVIFLNTFAPPTFPPLIFSFLSFLWESGRERSVSCPLMALVQLSDETDDPSEDWGRSPRAQPSGGMSTRLQSKRADVFSCQTEE